MARVISEYSFLGAQAINRSVPFCISRARVRIAEGWILVAVKGGSKPKKEVKPETVGGLCKGKKI